VIFLNFSKTYNKTWDIKNNFVSSQINYSNKYEKAFQTDYKIIDQKICMLASSLELNYASLINPINSFEEKKRFFSMLTIRAQYEPEFKYIQKFPEYNYFSFSSQIDTYKKELKEIIKQTDYDVLGIIFEKKIRDVLEKIELVKSIGTENFSNNSEKYYGTPDKKLEKYALEILEKKTIIEKKDFSAKKAKNIFLSALKKRKLNYKIRMRDIITPRVAVNHITKEILLSANATFGKQELQRLIAHEIETHIYRRENGLLQPFKIFSTGLSKETLETEEGLAVMVENKYNLQTTETMRDYAGRVIAINLALKKTFYETFTELTNYFDKEKAFTLTLRAKRGLKEQNHKGAYTKDFIYLKGFLDIVEFENENCANEEKNCLEKLYYGKYSTMDSKLALQIDGLQKPKYLPSFLKKTNKKK
jgi:uncharacterized protein (TIGR02421 family)